MFSSTKSLSTFPTQIPLSFQHPNVRSVPVVRSSIDDSDNITSSNDINASPTVRPPITPPETVRFKRGSRRKRKQQLDGFEDRKPSKPAPAPPKDWESMTLTEKAVELYMGEKGMLFWLNKFAYASIFIVIGGWILFRFVGPALNLYQLDTPPLSPSSMFKG